MNYDLAELAGVLALMGFVIYISTMFRRINPTRPSRSTWVVWSALNILMLYGMFKAETATLQMSGVTLGSVFAALFSLKYGKKADWSPLDKFVLGGAFVGLCLMFYKPAWGLGVSIVVGPVIGSIPGLIEAWKNPSKENKLSWLMWATSSLISLMLVSSWSVEEAAQPASFLLNQSLMVLVVFVSPHRRREVI